MGGSKSKPAASLPSHSPISRVIYALAPASPPQVTYSPSPASAPPHQVIYSPSPAPPPQVTYSPSPAPPPQVISSPSPAPPPRGIFSPSPAPPPRGIFSSAPSPQVLYTSTPAPLSQTQVPKQHTIPIHLHARQIVLYDANNYIIPHVGISYDGNRPFTINQGRYRTDRFVLHVCSKHASKEGCQIKHCFRFHVCHKWIRGNCRNETCAFDHHFEGEQNVNLCNRVMSRKFGQDELRDRIRINLFFKKNFKEDPASCICMDYILRQCKRDVCPSYHVPFVCSWEMYFNNHWLKFSKDQNKEIESNFCDPSVQELTLDPPITSSRNKNASRIDLLFKNQTIKINFSTMYFTTSNQMVYRVRRLSTPSDVAVFKVVATRWLWYWEGDGGIWNFYTNAYVNDIVIFPFSDYIETQFLKKLSNFAFKLNNNGCEYTINFETMSQLNISTDQKRRIQRRPMPSNTSERKNMTFTSFWANLNTKVKSLRKEVNRTSPEFSFIQKMIVDSVSVGEIFIERIENPYLWEAFQLKKIQMMRMYGNDLQIVNEQYLFHGTSKDVADKICSENLDWRLYGTKVGNIYGKGTYFASSATISNSYASTDEENYKWIFVCLVLIGRATVGNSEMTLPPINPGKNERFDSTVNDNTHPQIYVKYNLDEYYPAYLVKFKT